MKLKSRFGLALLISAAVCTSAQAINIVPVFNNVDNETPGFDIFNQGIQDLFDNAEGYYEDIIEDSGYTLTLNFWYEDLDDGILGVYNTVSTADGRVTEGNIRIDTLKPMGGGFRDWYIDPFPATNTEFEVGKKVWGSLTPSEKSGWSTSGSIPAGIETGYRGPAVDGGPADLKRDMLSTIMHEIGHALGIRGGVTENDDGDFDLNPTLIAGTTMAANIDTKDGSPDPAHMRPSTLLMCGECGLSSFRRLPSHADILAIAAASNFTDLDIPRPEFLASGGVFGFGPNWTGAVAPDFTKDAYLRSAGLVTMNANQTLAGLNIIGSTTLAIGSNALNVNGTLVLEEGFSNATASVVVGVNSQLIANDIRFGRNGELDMAGGVASILGDLDMLTEPPVQQSEITGHGTITVIGQFQGVGLIQPSGGALTINAGSFDLAGDEDDFGRTEIDATLGNVVFNGPHVLPHGSEVTIGFGRVVTFSDAWTLNEFGDVNITDGGLINNGTWTTHGVVTIDHTVPFGIVGIGGTGAMIQSLTGEITTTGIVDFLGHSTIGGAVNVNTEAARFSAGGVFTGTAVVTLAPSTTMHLIFDNIYTIEDGATFTGPGTLVIAELATVVIEDGAELDAPLVMNGRMELGNSPGQVTINADFGMGFNAVAEFEIGGLSARNYDSLDVTGFNAILDGTLELSLINGFVPDIGDMFTIIQAGSIVGTFDTINDLSGGLIFDVIYNPTSVVVNVTKLLGDLNRDGFVGIDDLNIVLANWNQNVPLGDPLADPNGDGFVGIDDLNTVLGNWNAGTPPGAQASNVIPEPTVAGVMMWGVMGVIRRKRYSA